MDSLVSDTKQLIFDLLHLIDQINFRSVCKYHMSQYPITNLLTNNPNLSKLTDEILSLHPFVISLLANSNEKIININHLINLQALDAGGTCGINNFSKLINLTSLNVIGNTKITDLNQLTKLQFLSIGTNCEINELLQLRVLHLYTNTNVLDINHMVNLQKLIISNNCNIIYEGFSRLTNLSELHIVRNTTITNISYYKRMSN